MSLANSTYPPAGILSLLRRNDVRLNKGSRFLMYGYNPLVLVSLRVASWRYRAKLVAFVFDSHTGAIEHKRWLRRHLIDGYYRLGVWLLRATDGILLLNRKAYSRLGLSRKPFLVSRVGVDAIASNPTGHACAAKEFSIVYAGSLETYNGVVQLVESLQFLEDPSINVQIVGDGALTQRLQILAAQDARITLHGRATKATVDGIIRRANLLVNLRDLQHPVSDYSFPSKLVEYLASGVPVLSTLQVGDLQSGDLVDIVTSLEPQQIAAAIMSAKSSQGAQAIRAVAAQRYIERRHLWPVIGDEIFDFLAAL